MTACSPQSVEAPLAQQPAPGSKILRVALENNPLSIDPRYVADDEGEQIVDALFDPLVRYDRDFRVVPAAAESWTIDDDGLRYTFTLRDARFHDGSVVTAQDFVRTFAAIADGLRTPKSYLDYLLRDVSGITASRRFGTPLAGVRALDDRTLEIVLRRPRATFLELLTDPSLVPLPAVADTDPEGFSQNPVGNGPFQMMGSYEPGAFVRLTRFEQYHAPAKVDEVLFTLFPNDPTREGQWRAFTERQVQVAFVPPQRRSEAFRRFGVFSESDRPYGVHDGLTATVYLYSFDTSKAPFDDVRVRQAISFAIDREELASEVMGNMRVGATSLLPLSFPQAVSELCSHCMHNPDQAVVLFSDALGSPEAELELTLFYPRGAVHTLIAERMAAMIETALPISVALRPIDYGNMGFQRRFTGASMLRLGWRSNAVDHAEYLEPLFGSDYSNQGSITGFSDRAVDGLLWENRAISSGPIRIFLYRQLERQLLDDASVLPILWYRQERVISNELDNAFLYPSGRLNLLEVDVLLG